MRGSNRRDSIDTAKEERSFIKTGKAGSSKMLTISEVFGIKGKRTKISKKPKTVRNMTNQNNLQSRL